MSPLANAIWWLGFTASGVCIEAVAPGLDALVPGVIILLQERDYKAMLWLLPLFILLQEGVGSSPFGGSVLWYLAVVICYRLGRRFFPAGNFIFVFALSAVLGAALYGLQWLQAPVRGIVFDMNATMDACLLQAAYVPFMWKLCAMLRPKAGHAEE